MFLPAPFSEPKSVAAREKELNEFLAKATQPVCSSCHHHQVLSVTRAGVETILL